MAGAEALIHFVDIDADSRGRRRGKFIGHTYAAQGEVGLCLTIRRRDLKVGQRAHQVCRFDNSFGEHRITINYGNSGRHVLQIFRSFLRGHNDFGEAAGVVGFLRICRAGQQGGGGCRCQRQVADGISSVHDISSLFSLLVLGVTTLLGCRRL